MPPRPTHSLQPTHTNIHSHLHIHSCKLTHLYTAIQKKNPKNTNTTSHACINTNKIQNIATGGTRNMFNVPPNSLCSELRKSNVLRWIHVQILYPQCILLIVKKTKSKQLFQVYNTMAFWVSFLGCRSRSTLVPASGAGQFLGTKAYWGGACVTEHHWSNTSMAVWLTRLSVMTGEVECFCNAFVFTQVASQNRGCELYKLLVVCCKWRKKKRREAGMVKLCFSHTQMVWKAVKIINSQQSQNNNG